MQKFYILLFTTIITTFAQNKYPQDYFQHPLDIPLVISGTFAELRSNHFHAGLDIKTQQRQGLKVYAVADGYVSRIKVAHFGYGKALYVTHPNGYVSVYAHLQKFSPEIEAFIKAKQYKKESYEIEVFPNVNQLTVTKGQVIAFSGNSGGSGGPHLHFEIRDNAERPINPLLFGLTIKDTQRPTIARVYAYPLDDNSHVNGSNKKQKLDLTRKKDGTYKVKPITAYGRIGFGISTYDRQDLSSNLNGIYDIKAFHNGQKIYEISSKRFAFNETKYINRLIDYSYFKKNRKRIQKLFRQINNPLSMHGDLVDEGNVLVYDNLSSIYHVKIKDFHGNNTSLDIDIKGAPELLPSLITPQKTTPNYVTANQETVLKDGKITVTIPKNTFYDDMYIDYNVSSDTLFLHNVNTPLRKRYTISYDISDYYNKDKDKLYIAQLIGKKNYPKYSSTKRKENTLSTRTKTLGKYALALDTINPTIKPVNFSNGKWLSKYRFLKLRISDKQTGISNYRATVNGKWILMEYDYKTKILTHDFNDNIVTDTKNELQVIVTDNVGNATQYSATFYRKK